MPPKHSLSNSGSGEQQFKKQKTADSITTIVNELNHFKERIKHANRRWINVRNMPATLINADPAQIKCLSRFFDEAEAILDMIKLEAEGLRPKTAPSQSSPKPPPPQQPEKHKKVIDLTSKSPTKPQPEKAEKAIEIVSPKGLLKKFLETIPPDKLPGPGSSWKHEYDWGVKGDPDDELAANGEAFIAANDDDEARPSIVGGLLKRLHNKATGCFKLQYMGDVEFTPIPTNGDGNCLFSTISWMLYGTPDYWYHVKYQHLYFFRDVLLNKKHPRHARYTRLNTYQQDVRGQGPTNIWMQLHIPDAWQNSELLQVTADLYGLFIICYDRSIRNGKQDTSIDIFGNYNGRHVFMEIRNSHYQPLRPCKEDMHEILFPYVNRTTVDPRPGRHGGTRNIEPYAWRPEIPSPEPHDLSIVFGCNTEQGFMDKAIFEETEAEQREELAEKYPDSALT